MFLVKGRLGNHKGLVFGTYQGESYWTSVKDQGFKFRNRIIAVLSMFYIKVAMWPDVSDISIEKV